MAVSLFWQEVETFGGDIPNQLRQGIIETAGQVARSDTTIEVRGLDHISGPSVHAANRLLNAPEILRSMVKADGAGFDCLILGSNLDAILWEAKEVLRTPVVGSGETSILWGLALGEQLGMVVSEDKHIPLMKTLITSYGLNDRFITHKPVRSITLLPKEYPHVFKSRVDIVKRFREQAIALVDDGAEVIVTGCMLLGLLCAKEKVIEPTAGIPLVNSIHVSIKQAEAVADMKKSGVMPDFSRLLRYKIPSPSKMDDLYRELGLRNT